MLTDRIYFSTYQPSTPGRKKMIKNSLKILTFAFLILCMGSVISAADDSVDAPRLPTAASLGLRPSDTVGMLSRQIEDADAIEFSNGLLQVDSHEDVNALLAKFKGFPPEKQQLTLNAVVIMAMGTLERAHRVDQTVLWTTARLTDFLLGNCFLPATHVWLEGDPMRLAYLRNPAVAQSVMRGRDDPFLTHLTKGFMAGAKAFGQTYCNLYDFILAQKVFDAHGIFRNMESMPAVIAIFSRAVADNWCPTEDFSVAIEEAKRDDEDRRSATGSTSTIGTIASGAVLRTLSAQRFTEEAVVFVEGLFGKEIPLDELLGQYIRLSEPQKSEVLKVAIVQALTFLDGADAGRNPKALWVTARLAAFLLSNRSLPLLHGWLDGVTVDVEDDDVPSNVSALTHLMYPRTGMLHMAMASLVAGEAPSEVAGSSTSIFDLTKFFKNVAAQFDEAYRATDRMSKAQFHMDKARFPSRVMPHFPAILDIAAQMALVAQERASELAREADSRSPARGFARAALLSDGLDDDGRGAAAVAAAHDDSALRVVVERPSLGGRRVDAVATPIPAVLHAVPAGKFPGTGSNMKSPLLVDAASINSMGVPAVTGSGKGTGDDDDTPKPKRGLLYYLTFGCCC